MYKELQMLLVAKAIVEFAKRPNEDTQANMYSEFNLYKVYLNDYPDIKFEAADKLADIPNDITPNAILENRIIQTLQFLGVRANIKAIQIYIESIVNLSWQEKLYTNFYEDLREIICREIDMFYMKKVWELDNDEHE